MTQNIFLKVLKTVVLSCLLLQGGCTWFDGTSKSEGTSNVTPMGGPSEDEVVMNDFEEQSDEYSQEDFEEPLFEDEDSQDAGFEVTQSSPETTDYSDVYVPASRRYPPTRPKQMGRTLGEEFEHEEMEASTEVVSQKLEYATYIARKGDSMWSIAKRNGVSVKEMLDLNGMTKNSILRVGQELILPVKEGQASASQTPTDVFGNEAETYTVQPGDSLSRIAAKRNTTVKSLQEANNLVTDMIRVGQKLEVPKNIHAQASSGHALTHSTARPNDPNTYTIRNGDALSTIARMHGMSTEELMELNGITNPDRIGAGQTLRVKQGARSQTTQPTIKETVSSLSITPKKIEETGFFSEEMDDSIFDKMDMDVESEMTASENEVSDRLLDSSIFDSADDDVELVPVDLSVGIDL